MLAAAVMVEGPVAAVEQEVLVAEIPPARV
jgi:hypothetical protein